MARPLKIGLAVLGGLIALAVIGIGIFVATFDPNRYKSTLVEQVEKRTGRKLAIAGDIRLAFFPKLGAQVAGVSLSGPGGRGEFVKIDEARVALAFWPLLRGEAVVDRVVLRGLTADLVRGRDGRTNYEDLFGGAEKPAEPTAAPKPAAAGKPIELDIAGVTLTNGSVRWRDEQAGTDVRIADLALETGRIAEGVAARATVSARLSGTQPALALAVKGTSGYRFAFAPQRSVDLDGLDLRLEGDAAGLRGLVATLAAPKLALAGDALRIPDWKLAVQMKPAAREVRIALDGAAEADLAKERATLTARGQVDSANIEARADITRFSKPHIGFDVEADRIDVDALRAGFTPSAAKPAPKGGGGAGGGGAAAESPIDLSALKTLDASGRVRIGALAAAGIKAERIDATIKAAGGRLAVEPLSLALYGGGATGAIAVNANDASYAIRQSLTNIAIGPLLADVAKKDLIAGRANVALDLRTRGSTVTSLKRGLDGSAKLAVKDGSLKGINLAETARKVRALARGGVEEFASVQSEKTDFAELTASFVVKNGVARSDDLKAVSPALQLGGAGSIDIAAGSVDYTLKTILTGGSTTRAVTVPVVVSGPFDALRYRVDVAALATENLKDEAVRRLEKAIGGGGSGGDETRRRVGDALKGLFGK